MPRCMKCDGEFETFTDVNDHNRESHENQPFRCPICGRYIQTAHRMALHVRQCESRRIPECSICRKKFGSYLNLRDHMNERHAHGLRKKCRLCQARFDTVSDLDDHIYEVHGESIATRLPKPDPVTFDPDFETEEALHKLYTRYWSAIRSSYKFDPLLNVYNFRVLQYRPSMLSDLIQTVYLHQRGIFKINLGMGLILQHKPTGVFRYYHAGQNNELLEEPRRIASRRDLHNLIEDLEKIDLNQQGAMSRPDTTNTVYKIANITIRTVQSLDSVPIGGWPDAADNLLQTLKNSPHILLMVKDKKGKVFDDNLCFFRCLSSEMTHMNYPSEKHVRTLLDQWLNYRERAGLHVARNIREFPGVTLQDLADLEDCFLCNINVYSLSETRDKNGAPVATMIFRTPKLYSKYLFLNCYQNHFSRITSINHYARAWICGECGTIFNTHQLYARHVRQCQGSVRNVYPGGGFSLPQTVFDKLIDEGFSLSDHYYPYYIVYDFECMFKNLTDKPDPDKKLNYEKQLIPISVSVCANVPGWQTAHCIISEDPEDLINQFVEYIECIALTASRLVNEQFVHITEFIAEKLENMERHRKEWNQNASDSSTLAKIPRYEKLDNKWDTIENEWDAWVRKVPVVGFNSSRFDVNLMRRYLIPILVKKLGGVNSCITKGSAYITITTDTFMFLDICNFLAAGISYSKWLKGFGVQESKGMFPYEWLTSYDKLYQSQLPERNEFYSTLKQTNISETDYNYLQNIWKQNRFKTMFDFLRWYNNLDVTPFVTALEKMRQIFISMDIDLLKQGCVSLPGLAMTHMFKTLRSDIIFQLFDNKTKDYHKLVQQNIVGGPAIIFNRCTLVGSGNIKKTGPTPKSIVGYDCNGLYLSALKENMPTGLAAVWEIQQDHSTSIPTSGQVDSSAIAEALIRNYNQTFYKQQTGSGFDETLCVCYKFMCLQRKTEQKLTLQHKWNHGQKIFICDGSQLPVDGWIPQLGIIIQYDGCYFHGHKCSLTAHCDSREMLQRQENTQRIKQLLDKTGNQVISIKECEFQKQKREDLILQEYEKEIRLKSTHGPKLSMSNILELLRKGEFFGMIEVDIQVPFWRPDLREKMSEFPPIFKNVSVSIDDIGDTMSDYARKNNLMKKPRRCLISSYYGTKVLLPTPLIKWYTENGLVVTRIYRAIEYTPIKAFEHLVGEVTLHRKAADVDEAYQCYGETFKLLGNSYYGRCLTNIERHRRIQYGDRFDAARSVNSSRFRALEAIGSGIYEIHCAKSINCFKLPINIGYFVYGYSKLRMLQFYYNFLCQVIPFDHFELLEMDTDSLYFSLAKSSLEATVPVENKATYEILKQQFLVTDNERRRDTGIFKLEWFGKAMICLSPKTYICFDKETLQDGSTGISNIKLSTKGVSKSTNKLSAADFESALFKQETIDGINMGFRMKEGDLYQYSQKRRALLFLYIKRVVEEDGIHTQPLQL